MGSISTRSPMTTGSVLGGGSVDIVVNGGFADGTGWSPGFGWTIADGVLKTLIPTTASTYQYGSGLIAGNTYATQYTIQNRIQGSIRLLLGDTAGTTRDADNTYNENIVAAGADTIEIDAVAAFQGEIDNISVTGSTLSLK